MVRVYDVAIFYLVLLYLNAYSWFFTITLIYISEFLTFVKTYVSLNYVSSITEKLVSDVPCGRSALF